MTSPLTTSPWTRFEDRLLALKAGETIGIEDVVEETGLTTELVKAMFDGLTKAALFQQFDEHTYLRRSLFRDLVEAAATPVPRRRRRPNEDGMATRTPEG